MAPPFTARVLSPWEPKTAEFTTVKEWCALYNALTGSFLDAKTADWLDEWLKVANQYDTIWLDAESHPCSWLSAEIQIMRN
jgi:hypothetical protein